MLVLAERVLQTPNLAHYSTFKENELLPTANILLNHLLRSEARQSATLVKKYSSKKFAKVSTFCFQLNIASLTCL